MPSEDTILEFNQYKKSDKPPFIIYTDTEKIDICKNNLENPSTTKLSKHIPSSFSLFIISSLRSIENKHHITEVKIVWKKYESLREHAMKMINLKKKQLKLLTKVQQES